MVLGKKKQAVAEKKQKKQKEPRKYQPGEPVWYDYYYMTKQERLLYSLLGAFGVGLIGYIFYRSARHNNSCNAVRIMVSKVYERCADCSP